MFIQTEVLYILRFDLWILSKSLTLRPYLKRERKWWRDDWTCIVLDSIPCLWIMPPCIILATMQWFRSFIFNVIPCNTGENGLIVCTGDHNNSTLLKKKKCKCLRVSLSSTHTMGSSVFFWNCTRRTRVTFSRSMSPLVLSGESPFKYGEVGGGVTLNASSLYTSWATTSWVCSKA